MTNHTLTPGAKVKYREGFKPPGLQNMVLVGEILDREPKFIGHVYVRWDSGQETDEAPVNLVMVPAEGSIPVEDLNASNDE